jgi:hypothetical protein
MNQMSMIEQIADAVLYEGFLLYPYRLSSVKNRHRWNFGVLYPEPFGGRHGDRASCQTECLVAANDHAELDVKVRFLQLIEGKSVEREMIADELDLETLTGEGAKSVHDFSDAATPGPNGILEAAAQRVGKDLFKVTVCITNRAGYDGEDRDVALQRAFISTHIILTSRGGQFVSSIDPSEQFKEAATQCRNVGLWPVLVGHENTRMLASPIILYDHPRVSPQSPGNLYDSTEIDEILTLRVKTLSENEKAEIRAGDARGHDLLNRSEALTREELMRLHAPMSPATGSRFKKGDRVRLQPRRRADIFDLALAGKLATIVAVEQDFEDGIHLCVTVDDDPGKDLGVDGKPGHRFFFGTDEVEPA